MSCIGVFDRKSVLNFPAANIDKRQIQDRWTPGTVLENTSLLFVANHLPGQLDLFDTDHPGDTDIREDIR